MYGTRMLLAAAAMLAVLLAPTTGAQQKAKEPDKAHVTKAVGEHRAMADAHLNAAKCLESGRSEKECHAQLARDCRGLGIGKYCGLQHRH